MPCSPLVSLRSTKASKDGAMDLAFLRRGSGRPRGIVPRRFYLVSFTSTQSEPPTSTSTSSFLSLRIRCGSVRLHGGTSTARRSPAGPSAQIRLEHGWSALQLRGVQLSAVGPFTAAEDDD